MSVLLPNDLTWHAASWVTFLLAKELRPHLAPELLSPWETAEVLGIDLVDLRNAPPESLRELQRALRCVIEEDEKKGASAYPAPEQVPGYLAKIRELGEMISTGKPVSKPLDTPKVLFLMGSAHAPDSPWGCDELEIHMDGRFIYRNQLGPRRSGATGQISDEALDRLLGLLEMAPFHDTPAMPSPPGGGYMDIMVRTPPVENKVTLAYHAALRSPEWKPLVQLLTTWTGYLRMTPDKRSTNDDLLRVRDEPVEFSP